jgi:Mg2+ and Co2+ transporter CorA
MTTSIHHGSDPYLLAEEETRKQIAELQTRFAEWQRLSKRRVYSQGFDVEEKLFWLSREIRQMLRDNIDDLQDMGETVRIVEQNRSKFPIDDKELRRRRHVIRDFENTVFLVEAQLNHAQGERNERTPPAVSKRKSPPSSAPRAPPRKNNYLAERKELLENHTAEIASLEREQDEYLDSILESVERIRREGEHISETVDKQNALLDALNEQTENAGNGIKRAIDQIDDFLESAAENSSVASIAALTATGVGLAAAIVLL